MTKLFSALGLMSGTSMDGVDVAWLETDGEGIVIPRGFYSLPFDAETRQSVRDVLGLYQTTPEVLKAAQHITYIHDKAVKDFFDFYQIKASNIDVIGFHGQTITHDPQNGFTWQIGDAQALANSLGVDVVADFRTADVRAGGEGAPLLPLYHCARVKAGGMAEPIAIINIGGVSNITYIHDGMILAFDCGPGNALMDDEVKKRQNKNFDENGVLASQGLSQNDIVQNWLSHDYFKRKPPKSLDRNAWNVNDIAHLSDADALATLMDFTVRSIVRAFDFCPVLPESIYITGGGRHNHALMNAIQQALKISAQPVEKLGWNGDAMEAEGFAYLAVRSLKNLPLSLPTTTGVKSPQTGGVLFKIKN